MGQYHLDDHRVFDAGDHFDGTTADSAGLNVNIEHPLESLCPGHRHMALRGRFLILILCSFLTALAPLCWSHQRPAFAVWGEYTVKARQVNSRAKGTDLFGDPWFQILAR